MASEWDDVESTLIALERYGALRTTIAAMKRLIARIKTESNLHDLQPSVSHASLVFRRSSKRSVLVHWNETEGYKVSFLDPPFEISETRTVPDDAVIDVLRQYLETATADHHR